MIVAFESSPLCVYEAQSPTRCKLSLSDATATPSNAQFVHGVLCVVPLVRSPNGILSYSAEAFSDAANTLCKYTDQSLSDETPIDAFGTPLPPNKYGKVRRKKRRRTKAEPRQLPAGNDNMNPARCQPRTGAGGSGRVRPARRVRPVRRRRQRR